jgi:REP element-mobilizing transposase RayT
MTAPRHVFRPPKALAGKMRVRSAAGGTPAPQGQPQGKHYVEFVDPRSTPFVPMRCRGELPHLYKEGGSYFVTFRLWDAVVPSAARIDERRLHRLAATKIGELTEPPLRLGSCALARPEVATMVQDSLLYFDRHRYILSAWCVMPNHVHAVVTPLAGYEPANILHSWKSYTAHEAAQLLHTGGTFWERESFDHLIRSLEQFDGFVHYVEHNPVEAGLCASPNDWPYSSCGYRCGAGVPPANAMSRRSTVK